MELITNLTQSLNGFMFDEDSQTGKGKYSMDGGSTWQNFSSGGEVHEYASLAANESVTFACANAPKLIYVSGLYLQYVVNILYSDSGYSASPVYSYLTWVNGISAQTGMTGSQASSFFTYTNGQLTVKNISGQAITNVKIYVM